jgi:hypothetical protein
MMRYKYIEKNIFKLEINLVHFLQANFSSDIVLSNIYIYIYNIGLVCFQNFQGTVYCT